MVSIKLMVRPDLSHRTGDKFERSQSGQQLETLLRRTFQQLSKAEPPASAWENIRRMIESDKQLLSTPRR